MLVCLLLLGGIEIMVNVHYLMTYGGFYPDSCK